MSELPPVVPGEPIDANTFGNPVVSRVVQRAATFAQMLSLSPNPETGELYHTQDTNLLWFYNGTAWIPVVVRDGPAAGQAINGGLTLTGELEQTGPVDISGNIDLAGDISMPNHRVTASGSGGVIGGFVQSLGGLFIEGAYAGALPEILKNYHGVGAAGAMEAPADQWQFIQSVSAPSTSISRSGNYRCMAAGHMDVSVAAPVIFIVALRLAITQEIIVSQQLYHYGGAGPGRCPFSLMQPYKFIPAGAGVELVIQRNTTQGVQLYSLQGISLQRMD